MSCHGGWLILLMAGWASGANILFLSPQTSYSHTNFFWPIIKQLAARGHSVTFWNGLKPREDVVNVTQLHSQVLHDFNSNHKIGFEENNQFVMLWSLRERVIIGCNMFYNDPVFPQILKLKDSVKFDLIVIEGFLCDCMLPLVAHFDAPFVYLTSILRIPWLVTATDTPMSFAHFPVVGTKLTDEMNIFERLVNIVTGMAAVCFHRFVMMPTVDQMRSKFWNDPQFPASYEIHRNVSLWITNSHLSLNYQFPKTARIVEAAGLHFTSSNPLPQDVEDFVSGSGDAGFIVLSFGSILKGTNLPSSARDIFARVFARLPQRVLWKYEDEQGIPNLSSNVRLFRWLPPYMDLLAHPKIRLIMTHGGLFSNQEAVYHEVPLIGLPVFGDQTHYTLKAQKDGYARYIDWKSMTEENLYEAITDVINNPKYKENIRRVSQLLKDQMDNPLDRAVYWLEYVIRHKGAHHLLTSARHLSLLQQGLVDVMLLVLASVALLAFASYRSYRYLTSRTTRKLKQS